MSSVSQFLFKKHKLIIVSTVKYVHFSYFFYGDDIPKQNGIYILNQRNFKQALSQHEPLLIKFYVPWCSTCKSFAPEYMKLSNLLKTRNSQVKLGQVNGDVEANLAKEYGVVRFPDLKLFKQKRTVNYYGVKQAEEIAAWLDKNCPTY